MAINKYRWSLNDEEDCLSEVNCHESKHYWVRFFDIQVLHKSIKPEKSQSYFRHQHYDKQILPKLMLIEPSKLNEKQSFFLMSPHDQFFTFGSHSVKRQCKNKKYCNHYHDINRHPDSERILCLDFKSQWKILLPQDQFSEWEDEKHDKSVHQVVKVIHVCVENQTASLKFDCLLFLKIMKLFLYIFTIYLFFLILFIRLRLLLLKSRFYWIRTLNLFVRIINGLLRILLNALLF